jgi:cytochrome c1
MAKAFAPRDLGVIILVSASAAALAFVAADVVKTDLRKQDVGQALTAGGDAARAPALFRRYGCAGCHTIPGVPGADGQVGPSLAGLGERVYIAGVLPNSGDNLIRWIVAPRSVNPQTAMPATGVTEREARDLGAYLYTR